jgi:hypothetical protein
VMTAKAIGMIAAGLVAAGGGSAGAVLASPSAVTVQSVPTAFSASLDRDQHGGWDQHGDWDGRRDHDGGWAGHPWRWWHDWGISADTCSNGGGHVVWSRHQCDGGRFDDFHIR